MNTLLRFCMFDRVSTFVKFAVQMIQNPLGVIGLFITLIYGIAALVFEQSASYLEQRRGRVFILGL